MMRGLLIYGALLVYSSCRKKILFSEHHIKDAINNMIYLQTSMIDIFKYDLSICLVSKYHLVETETGSDMPEESEKPPKPVQQAEPLQPEYGDDYSEVFSYEMLIKC